MKSTRILSLINTILIVALAVLMSIIFNNQANDIKNLNDRISSQNYEHARLLACYTNNIHPCDDASIKAWNDKNPEDAFNLNARH